MRPIHSIVLPVIMVAVFVMPAAAQQAKPAAKQAATKSKHTVTAKKPAASHAQAAAAGSAAPALLGQYGDWGAYMATPNGHKVCFALAKPSSAKTNPPNRPRDPAYLFISTRPAEKVSNEVSVIIGYPFKPSSDASAQVGSTTFAMYTQSDGAWIKNAADEVRMVDAMRKGSDLVITGTSSHGTVSTDSYSLKGLSQALDRTAQECR